MDYTKYKHVSFDLWMTLIKSNPSFKQKRAELFRNYFDIQRSLEDVAQSVRKFDVLVNRMNELIGKNVDTFELYALILHDLGIGTEAMSAEKFEGFYNETEQLFWTHKPELILEKLPFRLEDLKQASITMNILSNTGFIRGKSLRKLLDFYNIGEYFAFQIYSDEVSLSKPNFLIFDKVYTEISKTATLGKKQVLHVGDNPEADVRGAAAYGFDTCLIQH